MSLATKRYEAWKAGKVTESKKNSPKRINESWKPLTDKAEIEAWLEEMKIENYTINDDGTVDVNGDVQLEKKELKEIPIQFGIIKGSFECSNNKLTSLKGCPKEVGKDFSCYSNQLTSLEGAPRKVGGYFECWGNKLTTLEGAPEEVGGDFNCSGNELTSLKGAPKVISEGIFDCSFNKLTSLEGAPKKVLGTFDCSHNNLTYEYIFGGDYQDITCGTFDVTKNFEVIEKPKNIKTRNFKF